MACMKQDLFRDQDLKYGEESCVICLASYAAEDEVIVTNE